MIPDTVKYLQFICRLPQTTICLLTGNNEDNFSLAVFSLRLLGCARNGISGDHITFLPTERCNTKGRKCGEHFISMTKCTPLSKHLPKNPCCFFQVEWMLKCIAHPQHTNYQHIGWSTAILSNLSNKGQ